MKKGQITAFIILGLIIFVIIGFSVYFKSSLTEKLMVQRAEETVLFEEKSLKVKDYVKSCLEQKTLEGIRLVSEYGGFFNLTGKQTITHRPYFFYDNKTDVPTINSYEESLERYLQSEIPFCIKNFEGLEVKAVSQLKKVNVKANDNGLSVDLDYPITISIDNSESNLNPEYVQTIKVPLKKMLGVSGEVVLEASKTVNGSYCATCFYDLAVKHDIQINMAYFDEKSSIFHLTDLSTKINGEPYELAFAA
ncbi:hypothetical protein HY643_00895 [Candidatus Woesearchaeota archaeon]|nr:hypothetical protein [Candidatus Woesearchaeota archaeon]